MHPRKNWKRTTLAAAGMLCASIIPACAPPASPSSVGGIRCEGGSGNLSISPALGLVSASSTHTLTAPSTTVSCVDHSGTGITAASLDRLEIEFDSLSCYISPGTVGDGSATIRWSDGTTSDATVIALLDGGPTGTFSLSITSGHFTGMVGFAKFGMVPTQGDCGSGISSELAFIDAIDWAPA